MGDPDRIACRERHERAMERLLSSAQSGARALPLGGRPGAWRPDAMDRDADRRARPAIRQRPVPRGLAGGRHARSEPSRCAFDGTWLLVAAVVWIDRVARSVR